MLRMVPLPLQGRNKENLAQHGTAPSGHYIAANSSLIFTNAKPIELSAMP
ncbi:hypothetical protein GGQ89_001280 [Sphingomonas yabuuchiae]|uniref:Uncharacterized protein n=1 Tax=Sphingomonas yabuuchiae TaxID=172044 RepID=A0ABR6K7K6_9SPHN|nr:hypothetical protein [Sphingomonas yabuuchiae]